MEKIKLFLGIGPADNVITRLLSSLCLGAMAIELFITRDFRDLSNYGSVGLITVCCFFAVIFILLTAFSGMLRKREENIDKIILAIVFGVYATYTSYCAGETYFALGMTALAAVLIFYYSKKGYFRAQDFSNKKMIVTVCVIAGIFSLFLGLCLVLRYLSYRTPNYDFGIFCQMFEYFRRCFKPLTTVERDGLLSHFSVHMSLIYYLLLPFYAIAPSPVTIQLMQVVALGSAAVPVYFLCRHAKLSNRATALFMIAVMLHPALFGGATYDFHENCLLVPLLLWMFYFFEKEKYIPMAVMAALVCTVKEDAPIYIIFFAIWMFISRKQKKWAVLSGSGALIYFIVILLIMSVYGDGIMSGRYANFLSSSDDSLFSAIKNIIADPAYVFTQLFVSKDGTYSEKIIFILQMLVPFAFLPFCVKKVSNLILVFPMLLINLMSVYVYQYDIGFQYVYGPLPFLIYLAIINAGEMEDEKTLNSVRTAAAASVFLFAALFLPKTLDAVYYSVSHADETALITECLEAIPDDSVIVSSTYFIPNLSKTEVLYEDYYHEPGSGERADYYIVDGRFLSNKLKFVEKYLDAGYEVEKIVYADGTVLEGGEVSSYTLEDITAVTNSLVIVLADAAAD